MWKNETLCDEGFVALVTSDLLTCDIVIMSGIGLTVMFSPGPFVGYY